MSRAQSQKRPAILATSVAALLSLGLLLIAPRVEADEYWDGTTTIGSNIANGKGGDGTWDSTTNWVNASGTNPTGYDPTQTAHFASIGGVVTINPNIAFTALEFDTPATGTDAYFIEPSFNYGIVPTGAATITALANDNATIDAPITGTGSITIGGAGTVTLRNDNTYSGGTTLTNGGTLYVDNNSALGTGTLTISGAGTTLGTHVDSTTLANNISVQTSSFSIVTASGAVNLILNGTIDLTGATRTFVGGTLKEQIQFGTGGIGVAGETAGVNFNTNFTATNDYVAFIFASGNANHYTGLTTINNGAFLVFEGSTADSGIHGNVDVEGNGVVDYLGGAASQIVPTATVTDNSTGNTASGVIFGGFDLFQSSGETIATLNGNGTVSLGAAVLTVTSGNFTGDISNGRHAGVSGGGIDVAGGGTLILSGTNTYIGTTAITSGTLEANATNTMSPYSAVTISSGATFNLDGFSQTVGSITGSGTINLGAATLTTGNDNTSPAAFSGLIQGGGGLTKIGTGTLTLAGASAYTGATTVNSGILAIDPSTAVPTVLSSSSALVVGGGNFVFNGSSTGASTQVLNGLTVNAGNTEITVNDPSGGGATLDLSGPVQTAGITRNAGGIVDFNSTSGTFGSDALVLTTQANDATGILGAWATVNNGAAFAANANNATNEIIAYTGYTNMMATGDVVPNTSNANVEMNSAGPGGNDTLAAATTSINTLTQNTTTASTVDTGGGTLQVGAGTAGGVGGIFITPGSSNLTIGVSANSGVLTAGGGGAGELILENNSTAGTLTINSTIADNGAGAVAVTVAGTGLTVLNGNNTYSGQTLIANGTLQTGVNGAIPTGSAVVIDQNGTLNLNGITQSLASISDGPSGGGTLNLGAAALTLGSANATTTFSGLIEDGGAGGSIIQTGTGALTLANPNNSYTGGTTLVSGTLNANGSQVDGSGTPLGTGPLTIQGGTLGTTVEPTTGITGTTLTNPINIEGNFNIATNVDSANPLSQNLTLNGNIDLGATLVPPAGAPTIITGVTPGGHVFFGGVISDGAVTYSTSAAVQSDPKNPYVVFTYNGSSPNTYTGITTVTSGAVLVLNSTATNGAIVGDLDVQGTGVVNFLAPNQTATTTNVTVTSTGNTIAGAPYDGLNLIGGSQTIASLSGSGTVGLGASTLTVAPTTTSTFTGVIENGHFGSGGGLTVNGVGTLQLGGANTYTGPTQVLGGTLQAIATNTIPQTSAVVVDSQNTSTFDLNSFNQSIGSLNDGPNGGGTVTLGSATLTTGNDNSSSSFAGSILGSGGLTKVGAGLFDLTGTGNAYSGPTLVNGGTLEVDGSIVSPVTVNNGATFILGTNGAVNSGASTTPVTLNTGGTFDNNGNLTVTGPGSIGVTAAGGGVMINNNSGAVISGETGILVQNPAGLVEVTNDGTITGTGGIAINALNSAGFELLNFGIINGQVLLGPGMNTVVLATGVTPEPVSGGGANSTLELAGGGIGEVNLNNFPNFGMLNKVGGGLWTLDGGGTFPGGTMITNGTINLQGTLRSNVLIQPLGQLLGIGTVFGNVVNVGTVQPGLALLNSPINPPTLPGVLHIGGNFTQGDFGQLIIQVGGSRPGEYSSLQVGGHAYLGGVLVLQQLNKGPNLSLGQSISIITASGGISGGFTSIVNPLTSDTVISPKVLYEPDAVVVEGVQGSFEAIQQRGVPLNANETAIAKALDNDFHSPQAAKIIGYLDNESIQKLPGDFDKIAPEQVGSVYRLGFSLADVQSNNLQRRTSDLRDGVSGFSATGFQTSGAPANTGGLAGPNGSDGKIAAPSTPDKNWGAFITGLGDFIHVGSTANAQAYNLQTGGFTLGADYKVSENLAVGVTLGYTGTDSDLGSNNHLLVNGGKAGVYGTYWQDGFYGDLVAGGGYNSYEIRRDALQGVARGNTAGGEADILVAGGYDWRVDGLTIGPTAAVEYTYLGMSGFSERGSLAPLNYPTQHDDSLRTTLGVKASYNWRIGNVLVRPEAQIAWQHEFDSRSANIDASFESGPGNLFTVSDAEIGRDSLLLSGGVSVLWNPRTSTYLFYDADLLRKEYDSQSITGGVRLNF